MVLEGLADHDLEAPVVKKALLNSNKLPRPLYWLEPQKLSESETNLVAGGVPKASAFLLQLLELVVSMRRQIEIPIDIASATFWRQWWEV
jgi:hypothetical protein